MEKNVLNKTLRLLKNAQTMITREDLDDVIFPSEIKTPKESIKKAFEEYTTTPIKRGGSLEDFKDWHESKIQPIYDRVRDKLQGAFLEDLDCKMTIYLKELGQFGLKSDSQNSQHGTENTKVCKDASSLTDILDCDERRKQDLADLIRDIIINGGKDNMVIGNVYVALKKLEYLKEIPKNVYYRAIQFECSIDRTPTAIASGVNKNMANENGYKKKHKDQIDKIINNVNALLSSNK